MNTKEQGKGPKKWQGNRKNSSRNAGVLEYWSDGVLEDANLRTLE
jgi:hypothetical protein